MASLRRSLDYFLAAVIVLGVASLLFVGRTALGTSTPALLFLLPVLFSTIAWGLGPGILAAFVAFLAYNFYFLEPLYSFRVHHWHDLVTLVVFLGVAILISQLVGRARKGVEAAKARELEATLLYELSMALAHTKDPQEIARKVALHMREALNAACVELYVTIEQAKSPLKDVRPVKNDILGQDETVFRVCAPDEAPRPERQPDRVIPLQAASRLFGEARLWQQEPILSEELAVQQVERLLRAFATQGALALERAMLAQSETRARILEESDQLKTALLSSVSHELRTPIATIKASVTSLLSDQVSWDTQAREDLLATMDEETDHLNRLVGNLLDMSRIESGALRPNRQWNLLSEIVDGVLGRMRKQAQTHHLEVNVADDLPLVPVDYVQMQQVFENLISNGLKYAPVGTTIHILASPELDQQQMHVQVINEGPPIASENLERIFDKFYRVTNADSVTGTGLGLSICKGIIQAHGGRIWAENLPGKLAFHFTTPLTLEGQLPPVVHSEAE